MRPARKKVPEDTIEFLEMCTLRGSPSAKKDICRALTLEEQLNHFGDHISTFLKPYVTHTFCRRTVPCPTPYADRQIEVCYFSQLKMLHNIC
jgi:hypothetical protein